MSIQHLDAPSDPRAAEFFKLFTDYSKAAQGTALTCEKKGDTFGIVLAQTRAHIYASAAEMVSHRPPDEAAAEMMNRAKAAHVRTPPLMNFDSAGVQYITARAWQFCGWKINPDLSEVAPPWDA